MDRELVGGFLGSFALFLLGTLILGRSSKDAVYSRMEPGRHLELHRTLRGHEGPVNAVGLQSGKVVRPGGYFCGAGCSPDFRLAPAETAK